MHMKIVRLSGGKGSTILKITYNPCNYGNRWRVFRTKDFLVKVFPGGKEMFFSKAVLESRLENLDFTISEALLIDLPNDLGNNKPVSIFLVLDSDKALSFSSILESKPDNGDGSEFESYRKDSQLNLFISENYGIKKLTLPELLFITSGFRKTFDTRKVAFIEVNGSDNKSIVFISSDQPDVTNFLSHYKQYK